MKKFMGCFGTTKHMKPFLIEFYYDWNEQESSNLSRKKMSLTLDRSGFVRVNFSKDLSSQIKVLMNESAQLFSSSAINENKDRLYKILSLHVDGGVIVTDRETPPNVAKCDYLYLIDLEPEPIAILIELKGTDIKRAIEQIKNTLVLFSHAFDKCNKVYGRIVFSGGTPNIQNIPVFMSLQREFKRRKGSLIANEVLTDSVENIC